MRSRQLVGLHQRVVEFARALVGIARRQPVGIGGEGVAEKISALALPIFLAALAVNVASMFVAAKMFDRRAEG